MGRRWEWENLRTDLSRKDRGTDCRLLAGLGSAAERRGGRRWLWGIPVPRQDGGAWAQAAKA